MSNERLDSSDELLLNISDLPTISGLIADTLRVLDEPGASVTEIEAVIMRDQSLTTQLLKVVNSAAYGFSRRIETVREATTMLGTRKIKGIAGAMVAADLYARPIHGLVDPRCLWIHSLAASIWAMEIIDVRKLWYAQSAVMAALLHDLGIVLLCQYAEERYRPVLEMCRSEHLHHTTVEQRELGTTHAVIGATLCAKWLLPVGLTQLVSHHHSEQCPSDPALSVVMLADYLAHDCGLKPFEWSESPSLPRGLLKSLGIDENVLAALDGRRETVRDRTMIIFDAVGFS